MKRLQQSLLACAATWALAGAAHAMSFAQAYEAARGHDAQYRAAGHELAAARQGVPIARSALLPAVAFSASGSDVTGTRSFPNSLNQDVRVRVEYATPQSSLNVRVPIFNREAQSRLGQAQAQTEVAEAVFRIKGLDLIDRLAAAYLQVLLANEARQLSDVLTQTLSAQLTQAQQRLQRGEGTRVDVAQLQASLDLASVRKVEADDQLELAHRQLRRVTGVATPTLQQLSADYQPPPLLPETLPQWLALAVQQSPSLQAREQALMAARMGVQRAFAGHLPRLDLIASVAKSQNESLSNLNQSSTLRSIGMQLSVPLYSGGGVDASVKQSEADRSRAEEDIRVERENLEIEVQRQYQAVVGGTSRIAAYRKAVDSSELALQGARRSLASGLATGSEVAEAQARHFSARRELAQARFEYLLARLRLMVNSGAPAADVAADLDRALTASPVAPPALTR